MTVNSFAQESVDAPTIEEKLKDPNTIVTVSAQIPNLNAPTSILEKLNNTVWMTSDLKRNEDLYIFFKGNRQGLGVVKRGEDTPVPQILYPIKMVQQGSDVYSGIFIVSSENKLMYYSFRFITPFYLAISDGYENPTPLQFITLEDYFNTGYILQLIY